MAFRTFLMHPTIFSVETMQNDIWIMVQKILASTQALRVLPPQLSESILLVFRGTQPVLQLSEQLAVRRPGPYDVSVSQKVSSTYSTGARGTQFFRIVKSVLFCFRLATWWFLSPSEQIRFSPGYIYNLPSTSDPVGDVRVQRVLHPTGSDGDVRKLPVLHSTFSAPVRALPPFRPNPGPMRIPSTPAMNSMLRVVNVL